MAPRDWTQLSCEHGPGDLRDAWVLVDQRTYVAQIAETDEDASAPWTCFASDGRVLGHEEQQKTPAQVRAWAKRRADTYHRWKLIGGRSEPPNWEPTARERDCFAYLSTRVGAPFELHGPHIGIFAALRGALVAASTFVPSTDEYATSHVRWALAVSPAYIFFRGLPLNGYFRPMPGDERYEAGVYRRVTPGTDRGERFNAQLMDWSDVEQHIPPDQADWYPVWIDPWAIVLATGSPATDA